MEDPSRGLVEATKNDNVTGLTLNLGSSFELTIKEVSEMMLEIIGNNESKIKYLQNRPGDVLRLYADSALFYEKTKWKPSVTFKDGLFKTIQWFESLPNGASALLNEEKGINWE